ncbi:MAG: UDP-N-acetylglucosamine diphosphorylase [Oscillospiraceae bacterium]|jgi:bifunctional UDP-N-acetylglucosamine pyrophosphorylase/glucosamine-1-phosphate N-acetyltransferase|nr:UDP-N-acetylglucosamine diphosphorylase [Oscillospiraceae bacterium]
MRLTDLPGTGTRAARILSLIADGVHVPCTDGIIVADGVTVGAGTTLLPGTILGNGVTIGANCVIGPGSVLEDTQIGDDVELLQTYAEGAIIESGARVGPFARLRPGAHVGLGCKVGNFVEIKNSLVGAGSRVPHLSYIGDTDMGTGCNIGCGCQTANYDGRRKHRTRLGDSCFIGCDTTLVAPVALGNSAYIAAGSVVTQDVPPAALVIARARQVTKSEGRG